MWTLLPETSAVGKFHGDAWSTKKKTKSSCSQLFKICFPPTKSCGEGYIFRLKTHPRRHTPRAGIWRGKILLLSYAKAHQVYPFPWKKKTNVFAQVFFCSHVIIFRIFQDEYNGGGGFCLDDVDVLAGFQETVKILSQNVKNNVNSRNFTYSK